MNKKHQYLLLFAAMTMTPSAHALFGDTASTLGLFADDIATTQALSMFSNHAQATYYNPAYLVRDRAGALDAGFLYAKPNVNANPLGYPDQVVTSNGVENDQNYLLTLGLKTDLSKLLKDSRPLVFGLTLASDRGASKLAALNSQTSQTAQSLKYGQQSLFLNLGAGLNLARGIDVGLGGRVSLSASANLQTSATLSNPSQTSNQAEQVNATSQVRPILGVNLNWGELLCPNDKYCWAKGLDTALAWRAETAYTSKVNANITVPNTFVAGQSMGLFVNTIDSYSPETLSAGLQYNMYKLRYGVTVQAQRWSKLNSRLSGDTIYSQGGLQFRDVVVPRAGFEYRFDNELSLLGGMSYERSPLKSTSSLDINFVDNDAISTGLGFSYLIDKPSLVAQPLRLDFGYQYRYLLKRDFLLATDYAAPTAQNTSAGCQSQTRCEYVTAKGTVQMLNASVHMTF